VREEKEKEKNQKNSAARKFDSAVFISELTSAVTFVAADHKKARTVSFDSA